MIHHITRATRHLIFWSLIATAIGITGVRLALTGIQNYKARLSDKIGELVGAPVAIGHLRTAMRGFSPELILSEIDISSTVSQDKNAIELKEIRLGIDLLDVLASREIMSSSWMTLVGAKLTIVHKADGSFAIAGLKAGDSKPLWLLQGGKYEVLQSHINWQDEQKNGRSLAFDSVDLALINKDERHRINVLMRLPKKYGESLRVSMALSGNVFEPSDIQGSAYIEGEKIRLPAWVTADLPLGIKLNNGSSDFKLWGEWRKSSLTSIIGQVQVSDLKLQRQDNALFSVDHMKSRFYLSLADNRWQLDIKQFLLETARQSPKGKKVWPEANFSLAGWQTEDDPFKQVALYAENLDLEEASLISEYFIPASEKTGKLVKQAHVKGMLQNFSFFAVPDEKKFAVSGRFSGLSADSMFSAPKLENLTGEIRGNENRGFIQLKSEDAKLTSDLFRAPLPILRLEGTLSWLQAEKEWIISSPVIEMESLSLKSKSRLRLSIAKADGQTFMDLQSAFSSDDASQASAYFPTKLMGPVLLGWLERAFIKGRVPKGGFLFYGKLNEFPFADGTGVFETLFDVEKLELEFHPQWPHLNNISGEVLFYQDSLKAVLNPGVSDNVKIKQSEVVIPSFRKSEHVVVNADLEGEIGQALAYMQKTPLSPPVNKLLDATQLAGDTAVKLELNIPIRSGASTQVDGSAQLNKAKLQISSLDLPVSQVSGRLKFNEAGVYSDTINAFALGHPIQVKINNAEQKTLVNVTGRASVNDLQAQFKMPWWRFAEGATDYRLQLTLPSSGEQPVLHVQSNLAGMALNLPESLAKSQAQQRPISLKFNLADKVSLPVQINYDDILKAAVEIDIKQQAIVSGNILVGDGAIAQRQEPGIKFEINRDRLVLQDWVGLSLSSPESSGKVADLKEIKVHSDHALWHESQLGPVDVALQRERDFWNGKIRSEFATGNIRLPTNPKGTGRIQMNLDTLDISAFKMLKDTAMNQSAESGPDFFPLLTVTSKKTLWDSVSIGNFIMETERSPNGLLFNRLEINGADQKLSVTGDWKVTGTQSITQTKGRIEIPKPGRIFSKLKISNDLKDTSGVIDFTATWKAPPYRFSLSDVQGHVDFNFKSGRILSIEPGFGRVLGILAMAQWIKRLQLDFSDVYEEGLTFNSIKGHFDLAKGKAITHNLVVDSVPAKISISGETDLINHTVDHVVNVAPKSADAVPIAGTIMGKVAAIVAKSLTGAEHEGLFFGSQYRVKGDWGNAQINSMHENEGLLQKTWNGITDFPWLNQKETK